MPSQLVYAVFVKVLVVEDDRKLASFLSRVLTEEGYTVDVCGNGGDAVKQVQSGLYGLVLLDWMLPDSDGLEVCRVLRRDGNNTPIILLTARGEVKERVLGLEAGADDYMVKPFEVEELVARVAAVLRRAAGLASLKIGPLELDRAERRARLDGKLVELTTREFSILLHLALKAGRVVKRAELLAQVWSTQFDPESNVVEVHMSRLRDKLGEHEWMVDTVRGRGYRLRAHKDDA
jgi:two-component system OmpR family response regulator